MPLGPQSKANPLIPRLRMFTIDPKDMQEAKRFLEESIKALDNLLKMGIEGIGPLKGAKALAGAYQKDAKLTGKLEKIQALGKTELKKNFASGFATSLGGLISLPVAIPASMAITWVLQIRMVAAMAHLGGFDLDDPPVRTAIALCLLGQKGKELVESDFHQLQQKLAQGQFYSVPKKTLLVINQQVINKLVALAGQKGFTRLGKAIPLAGGVVGGALDYYSAKETYQFALELFTFEQGEAPAVSP